MASENSVFRRLQTCDGDSMKSHVAFQKGRKSAAAKPEPPPVKNRRKSIQDMVIADLEARKKFGLQKYGTLLQAFNGRDSLMDAYQEVLDLAVYLRQTIEERDDGK